MVNGEEKNLRGEKPPQKDFHLIYTTALLMDAQIG